MDGLSDWILSGVTAVLGVVGLFVASRAHEEVGYYGGLIFFIFAVGLILLQIKRAFDRRERELNQH
jgi:hypothetical protein